MNKLLPLLALLLPACASVPEPPAAGTAQALALARTAARQVAALLASLPAGGPVDAGPADAGPALAAVGAARLALVSRLAAGMKGAGMAQIAGLGALGATLVVCEEGLARLQAAAGDAALHERRLRLGCLLPLELLAPTGGSRGREKSAG